jgi:hypothetical protein
MLQLSMTYETITEESAENGDSADNGFVLEACDCGARELAQYITREGFNEPSDSRGIPRWLTAYGEADYRTGEVENRSIHPGADAQSQKVWARVLRITGIVQ